MTRQEAVTIFYRYCVDTNMARAESGSALKGFADLGQVSGYATDAFNWAVATGLVVGSVSGGKTYLNPTNSLTRAQAAALLQRCVEDIM